LGGGSDARPSKEYIDQFRRLHFNLGQNPALAARLLSQDVDFKWLAHASAEDVASDAFRAAVQEEREAGFAETQMDWEEKNEDRIMEAAGMVREPSSILCKNCGGSNTQYTEKQTRSADEPMTTFMLCRDCRARWKF
jgi:transcription elongation factor S-II